MKTIDEYCNQMERWRIPERHHVSSRSAHLDALLTSDISMKMTVCVVNFDLSYTRVSYDLVSIVMF